MYRQSPAHSLVICENRVFQVGIDSPYCLKQIMLFAGNWMPQEASYDEKSIRIRRQPPCVLSPTESRLYVHVKLFMYMICKQKEAV